MVCSEYHKVYSWRCVLFLEKKEKRATGIGDTHSWGTRLQWLTLSGARSSQLECWRREGHRAIPLQEAILQLSSRHQPAPSWLSNSTVPRPMSRQTTQVPTHLPTYLHTYLMYLGGKKILFSKRKITAKCWDFANIVIHG